MRVGEPWSGTADGGAPATTVHRVTPITVELVERLVAAQFPDRRHLTVRPVDVQGWDNRSFRLGDDLVVRMPSAPGYAPAVAREEAALRHLADLVPFAVPVPVATGAPGEGFMLPWSVRRWVDGEHPSAGDPGQGPLADDLGGALRTLRGLPPGPGRACGPDTFYRGCHPSVYAQDVAEALEFLDDRVDSAAAQAIWSSGIRTAWPHDPVWLHGDIAVGNLLARDGRLHAVIDFGQCGLGDPACDLAVAWTLLDDHDAEVFRAAVDVDDGTWARGRCWALWKSLITLAGSPDHPDTAGHARALGRLGVSWRG
jgi:aminoglycoside phosphotransferase (APT) family kinase protein